MANKAHKHDAVRHSAQMLRQVLAFTLGCVVTAMMILNAQLDTITPEPQALPVSYLRRTPVQDMAPAKQGELSVLDGKRILVAIAAYDFSQLPHLEEVLEGFHDLCVAGSHVDVYIHATVPYPVTLIDLLNTRHQCTNLSPRAGLAIHIILVSPSVRLHLVDFHRSLFYEKIGEYDIFLYTEDDIRVAPHTVAAYLYETDRITQIVGADHASEYNVGVARYEYNYPPDLVIDDKTRAATANVTRVYWEHSWHPVIPKAVNAVPQDLLKDKYVHMTNHHQGMYIATQDLLKAWRDRPNCKFDVIRDRPGQKGKPSQPTEGTQRVWMSSQMLYGSRHCNVQQVIPIDKFGELTVLHLPNKNYRRVGRHGRLGGGKAGTPAHAVYGNETFTPTSSLLVSAMDLHIEFAKRWPKTPKLPYEGPVYMFNKGCDHPIEKVQRMMNEYDAYVTRGGVLSDEDMTRTQWLD
jgi:hypothetical protein